MGAVTTNAAALQGTKLNTSSLADTQVLTYDGASGTWMNKAASGGSSGGGTPVTLADDCGSGSRFLSTSNTSVTGTGVAAYDTTASAIHITSGSTVASVSQAFYSINNWTDWYASDYKAAWEVADTSSGAGTGTDTAVCLGLPTFNGSSVNFNVRHVGFHMTDSNGTRTWYATCGNGTAETAVSFTPTNANTSSNTLSLSKTASNIKFYDRNTLVATISTNNPASAMSTLVSLNAENTTGGTATLYVNLFNFIRVYSNL